MGSGLIDGVVMGGASSGGSDDNFVGVFRGIFYWVGGGG